MERRLPLSPGLNFLPKNCHWKDSAYSTYIRCVSLRILLNVCLPSKVAQCAFGQVPHVSEVPVLELRGVGARRGSRRVRGGAGGGGGGGRAHQHHDVGRRHGQVVRGQSSPI